MGGERWAGCSSRWEGRGGLAVAAGRVGEVGLAVAAGRVGELGLAVAAGRRGQAGWL